MCSYLFIIFPHLPIGFWRYNCYTLTTMNLNDKHAVVRRYYAFYDANDDTVIRLFEHQNNIKSYFIILQ